MRICWILVKVGFSDVAKIAFYGARRAYITFRGAAAKKTRKKPEKKTPWGATFLHTGSRFGQNAKILFPGSLDHSGAILAQKIRLSLPFPNLCLIFSIEFSFVRYE